MVQILMSDSPPYLGTPPHSSSPRRSFEHFEQMILEEHEERVVQCMRPGGDAEAADKV